MDEIQYSIDNNSRLLNGTSGSVNIRLDVSYNAATSLWMAR